MVRPVRARGDIASGIPIACSVVVGFVLSGCGPTEGQLASSPLTRPCAAEDTECQHSGLLAPIAVGASQALTIAPDVSGSAGVPLELEVAEPSIAVVEGNRVRGVGRGVTALLARIPDGPVVDFVHIWVEPPQGVTLHRLNDGVADERAVDSHIQVFADEDVELTFKLLAGGRELLGDAKETWSLEGDDGFTLMDPGFDRQRRLLLPERGPATTRVTLSVLDFSKTLTVEVMP